ncbi:MAG TPA: type II toxin-antitoxin system VapC family toxin [Granulicella sp.]
MIVVDTHVVFWLAQVPSMLTDPAQAAITEARRRGGVAISDKTLWELAMMVSRKQVHVKTSLQEFLREVEHYFVILPITGAIAERSMGFTAGYPKDPTDRIIGATALIHGLSLITADQSIRSSGEVPCIW